MLPVATAMPDDTPMFDPSILHELDWSENTAMFSPSISPSEPGDGLVMRPLCTADVNRGFFKVLGQLTETGVVSPEQFIKTFEHMKKSGDYYVTVVEDTNLGQIVATATLVIEHKFTHSCAKRGRIEDVVVSGECRGKQLGKLSSLRRGRFAAAINDSSEVSCEWLMFEVSPSLLLLSGCYLSVLCPQ
ncbi:glucosamine 6-phosphate N-acetyltransferase isoform X2 [Phasianus colchicus]|uniref:glucosamine 6-phosphate N-acetyltransferase isoform X2 n=1 Tax=Phasianus colchicus TaxID=9054 RepID=UPI00129E0FB7|nr:glucosamine 6-phosphate N-acetyltransferase isoform X2 [Phasianus colchicus]